MCAIFALTWPQSHTNVVLESPKLPFKSRTKVASFPGPIRSGGSGLGTRVGQRLNMLVQRLMLVPLLVEVSFLVPNDHLHINFNKFQQLA